MPIDWTGVDFDDPCAVLKVLRPAYYRLVGSGQAAEVQFAERRVRFTKQELSEIRAVISELEDQCAAKTGKRKRSAIHAGTRR